VRTAVYPGTFDPITNGHVDLIRRALTLFDRLIIAVADNPRKQPLFSVADRMAMIRTVVKKFKNVEVDSFRGLTAEYVHARQARVIVRGLRAVTDFEYEFQMALTNRTIHPNVETAFLMTSKEYTYLNSTMVKEIAQFGGKIDDLVPPVVARYMQKAMKTGK
jgi:pantetheine-phosphate adenylyltransferase